MSQPVAITGVGAVTPLGVGAEMLYARWAAGECGLADGIGPCREFEASEWLSRKEARRTPRFAQLTLVSADEAVRQAGWDEQLPCDPERIGCVIGTGIGAQTTVESQSELYREKGISSVSPLRLATAMGNAAAVGVQLRYGLKGESFGLMGACAAGAQALGAAVRMIRAGEVDAMVAGGAEAAISQRILKLLEVIGAGSESGISRPFDRRRDGFVLGEGAGVLTLESLDLAHARGAPIFGYLLGYGGSSDAYHVTAPPPDGAGGVQALRAAFRDGGIDPEEVQYVNAHGTSTLLNDRSETVALKTAFGDYAYKLQISSTKSAIGHLIGAAGAVEAIATLYTLQAKVVAPTLGLEEPEEGLDLDYVPLRAVPLRAPAPGHDPIAISNCFGFGGHNSVVALKSGPSPLRAAAHDDPQPGGHVTADEPLARDQDR
jgi:3-oxoacyl-[acyl-carrier-protein] synthase II